MEEISQLIEECNSKRDALKAYREWINDAQKSLLKVALKRLDKDGLADLEHYQNQFHIQLINIHDMRHDLKIYRHRLKAESHLQDGAASDELLKNKDLSEAYSLLDNILSNLKSEFEDFIQKNN